MTKRILVALSGTPFTPSAIKTALELGRIHEAEVTGVTVVDVRRLQDVGPVPLGGGAAAHDLEEHRLHLTEERVEEQVSAFEAACAEHGTVHRVVRETGDAMEQLGALWRYHDLTVIGLRGLFEYGVVTDPHDKIAKLLHRGVRPILAVAETYRPVKRALIAYNGTMESAMAMKRFLQMRPWRDVEVGIACFDDHGHKTQEILGEAAAYCRAHGFEADTLAWDGVPARDLVANATAWGADLIVLGSSSRGKLARLVLGDTFRNTLRDAEIPLFLSQ